MPRPPRITAAGEIHHVYARGVGGIAVYRDEVDRNLYLRLLREVSSRFEWDCLIYCLMTNHVHLLLKTMQPSLSAGVQSLHGRYAQQFNRRHERNGHLFQGRFGDTRIESDSQLLAASLYIARNPVEAGLCTTPTEWRWTSPEPALAAERWAAKHSTSLDGV